MFGTSKPVLRVTAALSVKELASIHFHNDPGRGDVELYVHGRPVLVTRDVGTESWKLVLSYRSSPCTWSRTPSGSLVLEDEIGRGLAELTIDDILLLYECDEGREIADQILVSAVAIVEHSKRRAGNGGVAGDVLQLVSESELGVGATAMRMGAALTALLDH